MVTLPDTAGIGWRPETAWLVERRGGFSEVIAENVDPRRVPRALAAAIERGLAVVAHGVSLSLGSAARPDRGRIKHLARVARALRSPLASEHVAFARAGRLAAPHFLPVPCTRAQLAVLVDHVAEVQDALRVPLALENVAAPLRWPDDELAEAELLAELADRSGARLLLDVANLHANLVNHGGDADAYLARLPLDRVAYLHVAGGARVDGMWRDTHAHPIAPGAHALLGRVLARTGPRPVLLERDRGFDRAGELDAELDAIGEALAAAPSVPHGAPPSAARVPAPATAADRAAVAAAHERLLPALLDTSRPPPRGFEPLHVAETRAIFAAKRDRRHAGHP